VTIHIEALQIDAIIGLLDFERTAAQRVVVDLEATYTYRSKETYLDYAALTATIETTIQRGRFHLLEEALLALKTEIAEGYPTIEILSLKLSKPDILPHCRVALSQHWELQPKND
jgi:dihydroneopterin aldolase